MNLLCKIGLHPWDANHCPRCGKDNPHPKPVRTAAIGDQTWMAEDLTVVCFRNGELIPEARSNADFLEAGKKGRAAWHLTISGGVYVREYNWFAVNDDRGLAPPGWRIPTVLDLKVLVRAFFARSAALARFWFYHAVSALWSAKNKTFFQFISFAAGNRYGNNAWLRHAHHNNPRPFRRVVTSFDEAAAGSPVAGI